MKRKIMLTMVITAVLFVIMAVGASACRQIPYAAQNAIDSGEITLGKTQVTITKDECKKFSFTPDKDGFYMLNSGTLDSAFLEETEVCDEDSCGKCYSLYYYISSEDYVDGNYVSRDFTEMKKGETYELYVANYDYYYECDGDDVRAEVTETIELSYAGVITDFDIYGKDLQLSKCLRYDEKLGKCVETIGVNDIEEWDDSEYLYTWFDVSFSEAGEFSECCLNENSCNICPLEIMNDVELKEGENTIRLSLLGFEKEFTVNCSYDVESFLKNSEYGVINVWASRVKALMANIRTGIKVMIGLVGIGSPNPKLGAEIIRLAIAHFFSAAVYGA